MAEKATVLDHGGTLQKEVDVHTYTGQRQWGRGGYRCAHVQCKHMAVKRMVDMNANGRAHVQCAEKVVKKRGECERL